MCERPPSTNLVEPTGDTRALEGRVLVLAPFGRDAAEIRRVLGEAGIDTQECGDGERLCTEITRGGAAAVVAEEALSAEVQFRLTATLAEQPAWSDFPLLLLLTSRVRGDDEAWHAVGDIPGTGHLTLLERPLRPLSLVSAVRTGLESRRRQYQVRDELLARQRAEEALRQSEQRLALAAEALKDLNERLEEEIAERTSVLGMLCDVASMANDATDVEAAIVYALKRVSEHNGWSCGHAWLPADDNEHELVPGYAWYEEAPARFEGLRELLARVRLRRGDGLVGRVFASGDPEFTNNIGAHLSVYKAPLAEYVRIQTAGAFPIIAGESIVGVMEFYSDKYIAPTDQMQASVASVGTLLGRVIERKRAERELRALNETLRHRARDLRRLATELSEAEHRERTRLAKLLHDDLQQLLLAVRLRLPTLVEGPQDQIGQHVSRIDELIGECMRTSRHLTQELSPPVLQCGTLPEVLQWLIGWFADKHGLSVEARTQEGIPATPEHLRVFLFQAVRELLFNIVKHSGKLAARVGLSFDGGYLTVQVEDDGHGFDPETVQRHLREPEGFGLFRIRERLEALLGRLDIQCTPQGGARFRLVVPITEDSASSVEETEPDQVKMATHPARESRAEDGALCLLVVDDHAVVRAGFVSMLNSQPDFHVVGEARDGQEAIRQAEALQPDAIVMDVDMPNMDGIEATRRITQQQPNMVVIGLSLHEEQSVARAMVQAGAEALVSKHAPAKDLIEAIRRACR